MAPSQAENGIRDAIQIRNSSYPLTVPGVRILTRILLFVVREDDHVGSGDPEHLLALPVGSTMVGGDEDLHRRKVRNKGWNPQ
jgi:hypothetical protein